MNAQHTITIVIPTAKILAFLTGIAAGCALVALAIAGVDLWAPVLGLPMLAAARRVEVVQGVARPAQDVQEAPEPIEEHPAVEAFKSVPLPVRIALNELVDHVLAEKWRQAA